MRFGIPGGAYLIHGTNKPVGVGMQITHGCIRLYPEDIEYLFGEVPLGMEVRIVNQRIKTGWIDGALYLEVHHPLDAVGPEGCRGSYRAHARDRRRHRAAPRHHRLGYRGARIRRGQRAPRCASRSTAGFAPGSCRPEQALTDSGQKKRRGMHRGVQAHRRRSNYFETDFLNMRSIFSLICSIACEFC